MSINLTDEISKLLDQAIIKAQSDEKRDYLGASIIGESCERKIQYQYQNVERDTPIDAKTLRVFARGHEFEKIMYWWLEETGFEIKSHDNRYIDENKEPKLNLGIQKGFKDGQFQGNIDGLITFSPIKELLTPCIWENKAVGAKTFKEISTKGIPLARPVYAAQIAIYQAYINQNPAVFTVINCDSMEIYIEIIPFNKELAQTMSDKAARIIDATTNNCEMPRVSNHSDYFECTWCQFKKRCWK